MAFSKKNMRGQIWYCAFNKHRWPTKSAGFFAESTRLLFPLNLKCHYDKTCFFSIEVILKHKQVACTRTKMLFTFSNISLCSRDIQVFKICKLAKWWHHTPTKFWSNMMKKDISANLYQKSLILCSKILLSVLANLSLIVCYHGNILGSRPPQY